jgi:hypothetical protein
MVLKIHKKRTGLDKTVLENTFEPFASNIIEKKNTKEEVDTNINQPIELHAIFGDKAYINDKWLKVHESINGYELKYIGKRGVVLQKDNDIKKLLFHKKQNNLIKLEGR